jgi:hypothetical protein
MSYRHRARTLVVAAVIMVGALGLASVARAAATPTLTATPSTAQPGAAITVTGSNISWSACGILFGQQPEPCRTERDGEPFGTFTIPARTAAGSYVVRACEPSCTPTTSTDTFGKTVVSRPVAIVTTTLTVTEPVTPAPTVVPAPPRPRLVAVPVLDGLTANNALLALHDAQLSGRYSSVPPHGHVDAQQPVAGTMVVPGSVVVVSFAPPPVTHVGDLVIISAVAVAAIVATGVGLRSIRRVRRRKARRWYHDHARLRVTPDHAVRLDGPVDDGRRPPLVRIALRDIGLRTCQLEEAPRR